MIMRFAGHRWLGLALSGLMLVPSVPFAQEDARLLVTFAERRADQLNLTGAPGRGYRPRARYGPSPRVRDQGRLQGVLNDRC